MRKIYEILVSLLLASCATSFDITVTKPFQVTTFRKSYANTHLVKITEQTYMMIDAGADSDAEALDADMRAQGIRPDSVRLLLLTHAHWDHAGGATYFQQRYNIPVAVGAKDERLLSQGASDPVCPTSMMAKLRASSDEAHRFIGPKPDVVIAADTPLDPWFGRGVGHIILMPAHTEGSLAVIMGDAVFVGDLLRGAMLSDAAATHFYMCDVAQSKRLTLDLLSSKAPQVQWIFPGHFGPALQRRAVTTWAEAAE
jgi:glyoxylase-like metal-dependent hydrolase (beta-lactamase superfamily II)